MEEAKKGYRERAFALVMALVSGALGWLLSRYLGDDHALPWIFWVAGAASALLGLFAPLQWIRTLLDWDLLTQDLFKR